jgi:hypothetical protein
MLRGDRTGLKVKGHEQAGEKASAQNSEHSIFTFYCLYNYAFRNFCG